MLPVFTRFGRGPARLYVVLRGRLLLHVVKESLFVSRGPWLLTKSLLNRVLDAAAKRPDQVARVEITKDGSIVLILNGEKSPSDAPSGTLTWDEALAQSRLVTTHTENHKMIQEPTKGFIISRE